MAEKLKYEDLTSADKESALDEAWELMNPKELTLEKMIVSYKDKGERVDEVLFREVMKVSEQLKSSHELLDKLYYEMGQSADLDVGLWLEVKTYVNLDGESQ